MNILTASFEIVCPTSCTWMEFGRDLRDIRYAVYTSANRAIQMAYDFQQFSYGYKERFGTFLKFSDLGTGKKSQTTDTYAYMRDKFPQINSTIIDGAVRIGEGKFKECLSDIVKGRQSIPSFTNTMPIPIRAQAIRLSHDNNDSIARLSLLSRSSGRPTQTDVKLRVRGGNRAIFNRLLSGEYKLADSEIIERRRKWYLNLTYKFESSPADERDKVMGIDMGIVNAAVAAIHGSYERFVIEGGEIDSFRRRTEARRRSMLRQIKYSGSGRRGHGRSTALKPTEKLADKVANFRKTTNHKYAAALVKFAVKNGVCRIQMEELGGISKDDAFLKSWTYFDFQTKIEYKAKAHGIEVVKINPKNTSRRCSCCGYIAEGNRVSQAEFKCVSCGFKANADYNAALNIANPRIEQLIDEELRRQTHERRNTD